MKKQTYIKTSDYTQINERSLLYIERVQNPIKKLSMKPGGLRCM